MTTLTIDPVLPPSRAQRDWVVPTIVGSALLMQTLNATVIVDALPTMARTYGENPLRLNMAITVYLLASAVFMPVSGWLADRFGARRVFLVAMVLFTLASAACGLSQNLVQLIVARTFQGMAGAALAPVGRIVILRVTPKNQLVAAMAAFTMPAMIGPLLGPVVGGFLVTFVDWRWIFFMNLPVAATALFLVRRFVPEVSANLTQRFDAIGLVLTGVGMAALIFGFENVGHGQMPPPTIAALFVVGAICAALYWRHAQHTPYAVIDLSVFRIHTFRTSVIGGAFMRIALGGTPFLMAMLFQVGFGMSAFRAGLMISFTALGALAMKMTAPPLLRRFGFRTVLSVNGVIVGVSFMIQAMFTRETPHLLITAILCTAGFFRSLQFSSLNTLAFADIETAALSRSSTTFSMAQQFQQSIGAGLAATLLYLLTRLSGQTHVTADVVRPAFVVIGAIILISVIFYVRLPANAGAQLHVRRTDPA